MLYEGCWLERYEIAIRSHRKITSEYCEGARPLTGSNAVCDESQTRKGSGSIRFEVRREANFHVFPIFLSISKYKGNKGTRQATIDNSDLGSGTDERIGHV